MATPGAARHVGDLVLWQDEEVSEPPGYPGAPPGWYPDPAGGPGQRWWDGYAWTEATVLPQRPPPPPLPPPAFAPTPTPTPAPAPAPTAPAAPFAAWAPAGARPNPANAVEPVQAELRLVRTARVAVAVPAACSIATLVVNRLNADQWLAVGRQFRLDWHDAQNHITPPPYRGPNAISGTNVLINVIFVAAAITALVWQHRAATAGRALGLPSHRSPAWGVGSWFVPIVNFWIPYEAVRDCLPPGDPHRARVGHWWIAWLISTLVGLVVGVSALFSSGLALGLSIPLVLADLAVIAWAPGIVTAIAATHREAVGHLIGATPP